jgi:hypothetical protein
MRRFAVGSPRSIAFASVTSSAAVSSLWRPTSARNSWRLGCGLFGGLLGLLLLFADGLTHLEPDPLELAGQLLDVVVVELVLERERLELGGLEVATLLCSFDEQAGLVGVKQFVKLILGQIVLSGPTL